MSPRAKRAGISVFGALMLAFVCLASAASQSPPQNQCVTTAVAGGTGDAITIPRLPCVPTTTLLILSITSANTTNSPTITPSGAPKLPVKDSQGAALAVGALQPGFHAMLTSNGLVWFAMNVGVQGPPGRGIVTPLDFGAVGDGVTDDTAAVQAALDSTSSGGNPLYLGGKMYAVAGPLTCTKPMHIIGAGMGSLPLAGTSGFASRTLNQSFMTLGPPCDGSVIEGVYFKWDGAGVNTSGAVLTVTGYGNHIRDNIFFGPCIGISESGNTNTHEHNMMTAVRGPNCSGIVVGALTVGGNTIDPRILSNDLFGDGSFANPGQAGLLMNDSGGAFVEHNNIQYFRYGTLVAPSGSANYVLYSFFGNTVMGDTDTVNDFAIIPGNSNAIVDSLECNGCWSSNAGGSGAPTGGAPVLLDNTVGAAVLGIRFSGARIYPARDNFNGVDVRPGSTVGKMQNIAFDHSSICSSSTSSTATGINVNSANISFLAIRGNTIGGCDHLNANVFNVGVALTGGPKAFQNYIITNNDFSTSTTPIQWTPNAGNPELAFIADNMPLVGIATVASADTVTIPFNEYIAFSGSNNISTILPAWSNREIDIFTSAWTGGFAVGGNLCGAPPTLAGAQMFRAIWEGCWAIH